MSIMTNALTHRRLPACLVGVICMLASANTYAQLARPKTAFQSFLDDLRLIVPIIATIALIIVGLLYSQDMIRKENIWNWVVGIVIAGAAPEIVNLFWGT